MIRVLIVDDSPLVRRRLGDLLGRTPGIAVVGTAMDGLDALAKIRDTRPDVVTLDVQMPRLDGLKVLAYIMRERPARVLMLSSFTREGAEVTLQALDLGAADFVDKASLVDAGGYEAEPGREIVAKIRAIAGIDPARLGRRRDPAGAPAGEATAGEEAQGDGHADVVVIGASTGGPAALGHLLPALPGDLAAAVIVVQHMPPGFTRPLAERLDAASAITVREAAHGDRVLPGEALVAPGGFHLSFARRGDAVTVHLDPEPASAPLRPSVDIAMQSAAAAWGARAAGVLLTGMGTDGAWGMWSIRAAGGRTVAESEESCVVYGMPRAAVELGAAGEVLPLGRIAERIAALARPGRG